MPTRNAPLAHLLAIEAPWPSAVGVRWAPWKLVFAFVRLLSRRRKSCELQSVDLQNSAGWFLVGRELLLLVSVDHTLDRLRTCIREPE